jgi:hypothetical protein
MRQIFRILIVVLTAFLLSWLIATPLTKVLFKYRHHDTKRLDEIYENKTAYDMLFIGSSRTHRSIYPRLIDSICGVNSFNAGIESGAIYDFKLTLDGYLVHHPAPKVIVLTLDLSSLSNSHEVHFYPQYYPYLNNKAAFATLSKYGYNVNIVKVFPFMMITDFDDFSKESAIRMLQGKDTADISDADFEYKGFVSNSDKYIIKPHLEKIYKRITINPESLASLNEMIDTCQQRHIKLIFTYAPEYNFNLQRTRTNLDSVFSLITQTAQRNHIPYFRDDSLELCKNPRLFANNGHLNKQGAIVYSAILAEKINKVLLHSTDTVH